MKDKKNSEISCPKTSIGGQAVLEGVMMRGKSAMVTAVRDADGVIRKESKRIKQQKDSSLFFRLPIVRGVVSFVSSMVLGMKTLMRSADVYGEGEPSNFEKWLADKLKINVMSIIATFSLVLGLALAVLLFIYLPQLCCDGLEYLFGTKFDVLTTNFIEGGLKLLIFLVYIILSSLLKDIKRTFMYHGAEHKTISCYESGLELTVENAKKCTRIHDRCGTTFMVFVLVISILVSALVESLIAVEMLKVYRVLLHIALLPLVAGLSYELLKGLAKTKCWVFYPLKLPGMLLQKITTREPSDDMIEVAIVAFKSVLEMDNDQTIPEEEFVIAQKRSELLKKVKEKLAQNGIDEQAEAEWIVSLALGVKRSELNSEDIVYPSKVEKVIKIVNERITGRPLWYCVGDTDFYGYTIKVDERVLIPRPETELLVENALKYVNNESKVLDLCTGSGAIAISVQKQSGAIVTAIDVSEGAIELAKENAKLNCAEIEFIKSDMFNEISGENIRKFDVVISNPPYIKSEDIRSLQKEVKDFEPMLALDGGVDGYVFYRIIAENAKNYLNNNGVLLLECGEGQAQNIASMLNGFASVEIIKDYENIERIVKAVL